MRKGGEGARLVHHGHVLTENRNGLVVAAEVTHATGNAEVEIASKLMDRRGTLRPGTVAADKGYDQDAFALAARQSWLSPHVAQKKRRTSIDRRTTRHKGYQISQQRRKIVEEFFGWMKTVGILRKTRHRGPPWSDGSSSSRLPPTT